MAPHFSRAFSYLTFISLSILWVQVHSKITIFHTNAIHHLAPSLPLINNSAKYYARLRSLFLSYPHGLKLNTHGFINDQLNWISSKGSLETELINSLGFHATGLGAIDLSLNRSQIVSRSSLDLYSLASGDVLHRAQFDILSSSLTLLYSNQSSTNTSLKRYSVYPVFDPELDVCDTVQLLNEATPFHCAPNSQYGLTKMIRDIKSAHDPNYIIALSSCTSSLLPHFVNLSPAKNFASSSYTSKRGSSMENTLIQWIDDDLDLVLLSSSLDPTPFDWTEVAHVKYPYAIRKRNGKLLPVSYLQTKEVGVLHLGPLGHVLGDKVPFGFISEGDFQDSVFTTNLLTLLSQLSRPAYPNWTFTSSVILSKEACLQGLTCGLGQLITASLNISQNCDLCVYDLGLLNATFLPSRLDFNALKAWINYEDTRVVMELPHAVWNDIWDLWRTQLRGLQCMQRSPPNVASSRLLRICTSSHMVAQLPRTLLHQVHFLAQYDMHVVDTIFQFLNQIKNQFYGIPEHMSVPHGQCMPHYASPTNSSLEKKIEMMMPTELRVLLKPDLKELLFLHLPHLALPQGEFDAMFATIDTPGFNNGKSRRSMEAKKTQLRAVIPDFGCMPGQIFDGVACQPCPLGSIPAGNNTCRPCPFGTFSNGNLTCNVCDETTYQSQSGSTACEPCFPPLVRVNASMCVCSGTYDIYDSITHTCSPSSALLSFSLLVLFLFIAAFLILAGSGILILSDQSRIFTGTPADLTLSPISKEPPSIIGHSEASTSPLLGKPPAYPFSYVIHILKNERKRTSHSELRAQFDQAILLLTSNSQWGHEMDLDHLDENVKGWLSITGIEKGNAWFTDPSNTIKLSNQPMSALMHPNAFPEPNLAIAYISREVFEFSVEQSQQITQMLYEQCFSWEFDVFHFAELTRGHPLLFLSYYLLKKFNVLAAIHIDEISLLKYLDEIEQTYQPQPYHNSTHAADVLQATSTFLMDNRFSGALDALEWLAIVLACAIHDVDHPGVNNSFLAHSKHPLALLYSDHSILEYHHLATGFTILERYNLFHHLEPAQANGVRKSVVELVLATDLAKHFEFVNRFQAFLTTTTNNSSSCNDINNHNNNKNGTSNSKIDSDSNITDIQGPLLENPEIKQLVLSMAIKSGDISNPTRTIHVSTQWARKIMDEFYLQGDQERALEMPISKFMDRNKNEESMFKCQVSFIDVIVNPLFQVWTTYLVSSQTKDAILNNLMQYKKVCASKALLDVPTVSISNASLISPPMETSDSEATGPSFFFPTFNMRDRPEPTLNTSCPRRGSKVIVGLKELRTDSTSLTALVQTMEMTIEEDEEEKGLRYENSAFLRDLQTNFKSNLTSWKGQHSLLIFF